MEPQVIQDAITKGMAAALAPVEERLKALDTIEARIKALEKVPATTNAGPLGDGKAPAIHGNVSQQRRRVKAIRESDPMHGKGMNALAWIRAFAASRVTGRDAAWCAEQFGYEEVAAKIGEARAGAGMVSGTLADGGWLNPPPEFYEEIIEILSASSVVRMAGPRLVDMVNGQATYPKQTGGATADYIGEADTIAASKTAGGLLNLSAKKLAALIPFTNDWLRDASPRSDRHLRDELARVMRLKEDKELLVGTGASGKPKGIIEWRTAANDITATNSATPTLAQVESDLHKVLGVLEDSDVGDDGSLAWFGHPNIFRYIEQLRDGVGAYVYPELRKPNGQASLYGVKSFRTTQLTKADGSGNGFLILARMSDVVVADNLDMEVTLHLDAAFVSGGSVVSGLSTDQSAMRAIAKHDIAVRHAESVTKLKTVKWGS